MFIDDVVLKWGLAALIVGSLVGAAVWSPAYAVAVIGLLLVVVSQAL